MEDQSSRKNKSRTPSDEHVLHLLQKLSELKGDQPLAFDPAWYGVANPSRPHSEAVKKLRLLFDQFRILLGNRGYECPELLIGEDDRTFRLTGHQRPSTHYWIKERDFNARRNIGRAFVQRAMNDYLFPRDGTLFLGIGATTLSVAEALFDSNSTPDLSILTLNFAVAQLRLEYFPDVDGIEIVVAAGATDRRTKAIFPPDHGEIGTELPERLNAAVISVHSIDDDWHFYSNTPQIVRYTNAALARARNVFVLANRAKFTNTAKLHRFDTHARQHIYLVIDAPMAALPALPEWITPYEVNSDQ